MTDRHGQALEPEEPTRPAREDQEAFWDLTERIFALVGERGKALRICQRAVAGLGFASEKQLQKVRDLSAQIEEAQAAFSQFAADHPGQEFTLHRPDVQVILGTNGKRLPPTPPRPLGRG